MNSVENNIQMAEVAVVIVEGTILSGPLIKIKLLI